GVCEIIIYNKGCSIVNDKDTQNYTARSVPQGPDLTQYGDRTNLAGGFPMEKEEIVNWIQDPESMKPGNKMTWAYDPVDDEEADKSAEYVRALRPSVCRPEDKEVKKEDELWI